METTQIESTLWAVVPVLLALFAIRPVSTRELFRFVDRYGVEVNRETLPTVTRSIRRSRTAKLAGAAVGFSLHNVLFGLGVNIPNDGLIYAILAYLLGAFVTAVLPQYKEREVRKASLVPRELRDYLPRTVIVAPVVSVVASGLAILAYELEPRTTFVRFSGSAGALPVTGVIAAATYIAIRIVIARSQPVTSPRLVEIDDALRTQAVHTIAGAGIGIAFLGTSSCLFEMAGYSSFEWLRITGVVLAIGALVATVAAWAFCTASWRVHRTVSV